MFFNENHEQAEIEVEVQLLEVSRRKGGHTFSCMKH